MNRIVHFEYDIENPERAVKFYSDVFGWKITKWEGPLNYWNISTGEREGLGIDGGFSLRSERDPKFGKGALNSIEVSSVEEYLKKVEARGGVGLTPKLPIPGYGYMAYFKDTEGNVVGLFQADITAK